MGRSSHDVSQEFLAYVCTFGPAVLVLVAVGNHVRRTPRGGVWKSALAVAVAALFTTIVGNIFPAFPPPPNTERWDIAGLSNWWFTAMFELGIVGAVILFLARRDQTLAFLHQEEVDRVVVDRELAQARLQVLQSQIDLSAQYTGFKNWQIFGSIINVFNRIAPFNPAAAYGDVNFNYNYAFSGGTGTQFNLGARYTFQ